VDDAVLPPSSRLRAGSRLSRPLLDETGPLPKSSGPAQRSSGAFRLGRHPPAASCEAGRDGQWGDAPCIHTFANNQETLDNG
jgi:hypothetical protein